MSEPLVEHDRVELRSPVLIAAFQGWNDAGEAATFAAMHLARVWNARPIASIDPEEFYDFQSVRPQVELVDGRTRKIAWPSNDFSAASIGGGPHDVIVLVGTEPNLKWKTFAKTVVDFARRHEVDLVVTLGALMADVPHSRPVPVTGTAADEELIQTLGLTRSRYEGPTGIVGVLHDAFAEAGIRSASLWAAVPHYLAVSPNPKAALALVERTVELVGAQAETGDLIGASDVYEKRVAELVSSDDDVQAYVRLLEERADERAPEERIDISDLPSADSLAAEVERFLRESDSGEGG